MAVFDTDPSNTVKVAGVSHDVDGEIELSDLQDLARDAGVKNFVVKDEDGNELDADDLPYEGELSVEEYNENA